MPLFDKEWKLKLLKERLGLWAERNVFFRHPKHHHRLRDVKTAGLDMEEFLEELSSKPLKVKLHNKLKMKERPIIESGSWIDEFVTDYIISRKPYWRAKRRKKRREKELKKRLLCNICSIAGRKNRNERTECRNGFL